MSSLRCSGAAALALAALPVCTLLLAGCRTQPMLDPGPIYSPLGAAQNRQAILRGLMPHRWLLVAEEPGRLTAKQDKAGKHVATVDVTYDDDQIDIGYHSSHGLRCEPAGEGTSCSTIHRAYNRWVVQLARDIEYGIHLVRIESAGAGSVGAE